MLQGWRGRPSPERVRLPRRADRARRRAVARRLRDEDGHARAARGERTGPHRRDRLRDAERDRARESRAGMRSCAETLPRLAREIDVPIWVSVGGFTAREYAETCEQLTRDDVACIELNLSCPNVDEAPESAARDRRGLPRGDRKAALRQAFAARLGHRRDRPGDRGRRCRRALARQHAARRRRSTRGCDRRSRACTGGYSGPALRPVALAAVLAARRATAVADRRHGRRRDRPGRARADRVRCDARRARDGPVRGSGRTGARADRARGRGRGARVRTPWTTCSRVALDVCCQRGKLSETLRLHAAYRLVGCCAHGAPQTQVQAPVRSLDQRMEALKRANDIRVKRAQLKKDLKSGVGLDRGDPRRAARVRLDREGVRHADGGAEVRPREGGAPAQPVPHQSVEDGRRPVRPTAARADWPLQPPVARRRVRFVVTGPSGAGKGTLIQLVLPRFPELALAVSATTRAQRPGEEDGVALLVPRPRRVRPPGRGRRVPRVRGLRRQPLRHAAVRDRPDPRPRARPRCSSSRPKGRSGQAPRRRAR